MDAAHRPPTPDLNLPAEVEALLTRPGPWRFSALVRALQSLLPDAIPLGGDGPHGREAIRARSHASLAFPPRDVVQVTPGRHADGTPRFDVEVAFFGLYGPASPLPEHDTQAILQDHEHGERVAAFLDVFNHRALSLLYRAHAEARWWVHADQWGDDPLTRLVDDLLALPPSLLQSGLSRATLLELATLWHHRPRGEAGLEQVLRHCLPELPLRVTTAPPRPVDLPPEARAPLGKARLGRDTLLGRRLWAYGGAVRVVAGPLGQEQVASLSDGAPALARLRALVEAWIEGPQPWELELIIDEAAVPTARLSAGRGAARLGKNALLGRPRTPLVHRVLNMSPEGGTDGHF